jgi:hypothetical protein
MLGKYLAYGDITQKIWNVKLFYHKKLQWRVLDSVLFDDTEIDPLSSLGGKNSNNSTHRVNSLPTPAYK